MKTALIDFTTQAHLRFSRISIVLFKATRNVECRNNTNCPFYRVTNRQLSRCHTA